MYDYLLKEYNRTKFPFFSLNKLRREGIFDEKEGLELYRSGKINVRKGMHGKLIELIIDGQQPRNMA